MKQSHLELKYINKYFLLAHGCVRRPGRVGKRSRTMEGQESIVSRRKQKAIVQLAPRIGEIGPKLRVKVQDARIDFLNQLPSFLE